MRVFPKLPILLIATSAIALTACQSRDQRRQELAYVERPVEQLQPRKPLFSTTETLTAVCTVCSG